MATVYPASERVCRECGLTKPLSAFYPKGSGRNGHTARCKDCLRAKQRRYTAALRGLSETERDAAYERWCSRRDDREALALIGQARCPICKQAKPLDEFYPDPYRRSGRECRCNACMRAKAQRYHWDPATPRKGQGQLCLFPLDKRCPRCRRTKPLYEFSHWAKGRFGHRAYCAACECAMVMADYAAHPERKPLRNAAKRIRYRSDPAYRADVLRRSKVWYRTHPEHVHATDVAWRAAHPEQYKFRNRKYKLIRRSREALIEGHHASADLRLIRAAQCDRCAYCLTPLSHSAHVDHMTALVRGGTDWPWNLCLTCPRCNCRKHAMSAGQYLALLIRESRHELAPKESA